MKLAKTSLIAGMAALTALHLAGAAAAQGKPGRITITGEGLVDTAPDMATVTLGVSSQAETAAVAMTENSTRLGAVLERLKSSGIEARDLQTSGLSLGPRIEYAPNGGAPKILGYEASNMLTVRVRDLSGVGAILDAAIGDGANNFNGLSFGLIDPTPALNEARDKAVADARRKAEQIATASGVELGRILEITEGGGRPEGRPMYARDAVMAASAVPVQGGEVSYSTTVTITWEIKQP